MSFVRGHIIYKSKHPEGDALIIESNATRYLYLGSDAIQSAMDLANPNYPKLTYTQSMMGFLLFMPAPQHCLLLGLGGGALAKFLLSIFPTTLLDVVEIREDIIRVAHAYFFLPHDKRVSIFPVDAYQFTQRKANHNEGGYDAILVDAYDQSGMASSTKHAAFFASCHHLLNPDGVLVLNMWATSSHQLKQYLEQLQNIFNTSPLCLPVPEKGNVIVFISHKVITNQTLKQLKKHANQLEQQMNLPFSRYLQDLRKHNSHGWLRKFFKNIPS